VIVSKQKNLIVLLLIIGVCLAVYFPSLSHISRSDQDNYFFETADIDGLWNLISTTYSYNRWRIFDPGDELSFKPLYFTFLSLGQWLFGYNYFFWQLTSVSLHTILVWQLFRILNLILPHILSVFISLNFSVLILSADMVTFQHMIPVIILYIFLLKALQHCIKFMTSQQKENRYFWKMFIYLFPICFIRETGFCYSLLIMVALFFHRKLFLEEIFRVRHSAASICKKINLWILSLPSLAFLVWNIYDYFLRGREGELAVQASEAGTFFQFIFASLLYPFFPSFLKFNLPQPPQQRVAVESLQLRELAQNYIPNHFFSNLNLILIVLLCAIILALFVIILKVKKRSAENSILLLKEENKIKNASDRFIGVICFICGLTYCCIIYVARFDSHGISWLRFNTYYFYPLVLFNSVIAYSLFSILAPYMKQKEIRCLTYLSIAVLSLSIFLNGYYNYSFNVALKKHGEPILAERKAIGLRAYYFATKYGERGVLRAEKGLNELALQDFKKTKEFDPSYENVDFKLV